MDKINSIQFNSLAEEAFRGVVKLASRLRTAHSAVDVRVSGCEQ